ncbi:MAG: hypothetical protein XU15_C0012G0110 [candidate division NC10 bacterium CSP1-5]|nr:MAG: hypothetical protein XU15_C0012G0110 [candidate division NC10 bacterium CSP1-5]
MHGLSKMELELYSIRGHLEALRDTHDEDEPGDPFYHALFLLARVRDILAGARRNGRGLAQAQGQVLQSNTTASRTPSNQSLRRPPGWGTAAEGI